MGSNSRGKKARKRAPVPKKEDKVGDVEEKPDVASDGKPSDKPDDEPDVASDGKPSDEPDDESDVESGGGSYKKDEYDTPAHSPQLHPGAESDSDGSESDENENKRRRRQ